MVKPQMKVEPVTLVYAKLENRPGTLEHAARVLGQKGINVEAVGLETVGSTGFLRVHTQKPQDALAALRSAGVEAFPSEAVVAPLHNKPGELGRAAAELAAAGLNVEAILTTADHRLLVRTNDNERAASILRKL